MLTYIPPELEKHISSAFKAFVDKYDLENVIVDFYNITNPAFDKKSTNEKITFDTEISLSLPEYDNDIPVTIREFIDLSIEIESSKLLDNLKCYSSQRALYRVFPGDYEMYKMLEVALDNNKAILTTQVETKKGKIECCLVGGVTIFGFLIAMNKEYDDTLPPVLDNDFFVQISFKSPLSTQEIDELFEAYIFELSSSANIVLSLEARPFITGLKVYDGSEEFEEPKEINAKLRPLMISKGMAGLLSLYNKALVTNDPEIRILYFTKAFEYVSQSVIRLQLINTVQAKLNSSRALSPDVNYILELESVYDEQKVFKKDKEAIISTAINCCDAVELSSHSPKFIASLASISIQSKKKEREDALKEFANSLVDTRNYFAHAKSNYQPTGAECPSEQLDKFSGCVIIATQQLIRWFHNLNEQHRVV